MSLWTPAIDHLIEAALTEDIGHGDITTENLISPEMTGEGQIVAKEPCVLAGLEIANRVFTRLDDAIKISSSYRDGDPIHIGDVVLTARGSLQGLLIGERSALNFLQRLSGIATLTRTFADRLSGRKTRVVDTRKTTPGWRVLEKYAVRMGGGENHRTGLYDGVLIKDNHIAVCGGIGPAVKAARQRISHLVKIEVEASNLTEVQDALTAGADVIMLDNMVLPEIKEAVTLIQGRALVEASGNVTIDSLIPLADAGVDIISVGALTHSAKSVDLSMRIKAKDPGVNSR
ncbi:MAG: carboxylating nicotinate-nucleotide diphosphorylase [Desulfobacterales bacterium]|jgi:nicotinate-nucleotide pyrophosphorylase (carboxylating)|nr:carboxylating nicotinate-nucleotide diphosphorylase [Desulfobacterales bacterium]